MKLLLLVFIVNAISCQISSRNSNQEFPILKKDSIYLNLSDLKISSKSINDTKLDSLILGSWVNKLFTDQLNEPNSIEDPKSLLRPYRSFSFNLINRKFETNFEVDFEFFTNVKLNSLHFKKASSFIYLIETSGKNDMSKFNDKWYLDTRDTSIIIIQKNKQYKYVRLPGFPLSYGSPVPIIMGYKLLKGNYIVKDNLDSVISKNATINLNEVTNLLKFRKVQFYDYYFYKDENNKTYPTLSFESEKENVSGFEDKSFWTHFVYLKDGDDIKLYSFKFKNPNMSNQTDIDSLVLKYTLVPLR